jgi:CubicO group peptidase (beta-lactamase class C family)
MTEPRRRRAPLWIALAIVIIVVLVIVVVTVALHAGHGSPSPTAATASTQPVTPPTTTPTAPSSTTTPTTTTPPAPADPLAAGAAQAAVHAVDARSSGGVTFGVAVLDRASGQETDGADADKTFYSASVAKLFLITDLLHQQEQGTITLSAADLDNVHLALTISDDDSMDALWDKYGGVSAVEQLVSVAHLRDTGVNSEVTQHGLWGGLDISARDVLAVYQYVLTQLSPADRDLIIGNLNQAKAVGFQSFNQAFGLLGPTRTASTKAKQGWMSFGGTVYLHTTGVLDSGNQVVVAILSSRPGHTTTYADAEPQLTAATQALVRALGPAATR